MGNCRTFLLDLRTRDQNSPGIAIHLRCDEQNVFKLVLDASPWNQSQPRSDAEKTEPEKGLHAEHFPRQGTAAAGKVQSAQSCGLRGCRAAQPSQPGRSPESPR